MGIPEGLYCKIHAKYICLLTAGCCFSWTICLTSSASLSAHNVHFSCLEICPKKIETFFHVNVFMMRGSKPYLLVCTMSVGTYHRSRYIINTKNYLQIHTSTYFVLYYLHGCCFQLCKYWIPQGRVVRVNLCF